MADITSAEAAALEATNPFNNLTSKSGDHPTAATAPVTPVAVVPPTPAPASPFPVVEYDAFQAKVIADLTTLEPDMKLLIETLQLKLGDEVYITVRRAT